MPVITIGMLAYNEAAVIEQTLVSLFAQTLFAASAPTTMEVELVVVANGCTDDTADIARATLSALTNPSTAAPVSWRVEELERPGICHAWNRYVHDFADPRAEHVFVMSADIELLAPTTLASMVAALSDAPDVWATTDQPIKDTLLESRGGLLRLLSARIGQLSGRGTEPGQPSWLCGQLYCVRGSIIRRLWLPNELPVGEDSLLYDLIVSDRLLEPARPERVLLAADATHRFEAYTTLASLLRHERWLIAGAIIRAEMLEDLRREMAEAGADAASIIARRDAVEPGWLAALLDRSVARRGRWLVPNALLWRRFRVLRSKAWHQLLLLAPLAFIAFVADFLAAFGANADLQRRRTIAVSVKH